MDASMRPRQACLGILIQFYATTFSGLAGFNEAEASLPRNTSPLVTHHSPRRTSFNEAEASLPRNTRPWIG